MDDFESDRPSLSAKSDLDRRQMLVTSLAAGFAAAVRPVAAQTAIKMDTTGLDAGEVAIPVADVAYARATDRGDTARRGITGFCWSGRITSLYAAHSATVKAGVAWYGKLTGEATAMTPRHPIELATELKAPVLGLYGRADQGIPLESIERMRSACKAANKRCEIVVYPDTPHAFNADYGRATGRRRPRTDGGECSRDSAPTASPGPNFRCTATTASCTRPSYWAARMHTRKTRGSACAQWLIGRPCICRLVSGNSSG